MTLRPRLRRWLRPVRLLARQGRRTLGRSDPLAPRRLRPAEEALDARQATRAFDRWPTRAEDPNRLEPETWPAIVPKWNLHGTRSIYTIGSCFARNIEQHFRRAGYDVPTLGFTVPVSEWRARANGILNKYTPPSIHQELEWALRVRAARSERARNALLSEPLLEVEGGRVIDVELAGLIPVTRERGMERRRQLYELVEHAFRADVVTITLGLVEAWWDEERRRYIQQTPNPLLMGRYKRRFAFAPLRFAEALAHTERAVDLLIRRGKPGVKILLTTSPVPLRTTFKLQDAIVANTHGKSVLRAVCGELAETREEVDYFPSYESAVLSKAPGVWDDDLLHVSDAFVAKIVDRMVKPYFDRPASDGEDAPAAASAVSWAKPVRRRAPA